MLDKEEVIDAIAKRMVINRWDEETWETGLNGMKPEDVPLWRDNWRKEARGLVAIVSPLWDAAINDADVYKQKLDAIFEAATSIMHQCWRGSNDPAELLLDVADRILSEILTPHQPSEIPLEIVE